MEQIHEVIKNLLTLVKGAKPDELEKIIAKVCESGSGFESCATPLRALLIQANKPETDRWAWRNKDSHPNNPE